MSYDFYAKVDTGGEEPHYIEPWFDDEHPLLSGDGMAGNVAVTSTGYARCGNYTSNVSGMWAKALTACMGEDTRLRDLDDEPCEVVAPLLANAVEWMLAHRDELEPLNPDNGWGNYEGAVTYLWDMQRFCEQHPKATLSLSY